MKSKVKSLLALAISMALVVPSVACKKGGKVDDKGKTAALEAVRSAPASGQIIQESDPFFDLEEFELTIPVEEGRSLCDRWINQVKFYSNCIVAHFSDTYGIDPETQEKWKQHVLGKELLSKDEAARIEKLVYDKYVDTLAVYDFNGKLKETKRCGSQFDLQCIFEGKNGEIMVLYNQGGTAKISELTDSMELTKTISLPEEMEYVEHCELLENGNTLVKSSGMLRAFDPNGDIVFETMTTDSDGIFKINGKYYQLMPSYSETGIGYRFCDFNLDTGTAQTEKHDVSLSQDDAHALIYGADNVYLNTGNGLCRVNIESGTAEVVLPWSQTDCYHGEILSDSLKIVSEEEYYFAIVTLSKEQKPVEAEAFQDIYNVTVQHLKKAQKNPHAGKRILSAMAVGSDNEAFYDCIVRYNRDMTKKSRVILTEYSESWFMDFAKRTGGASAQIEDQIYIDLSNGQGPDILINFGKEMKFERDNVLLDMNTLIDGSEGLDRSKVFDNILRACEKNGKLYRIPILFQIGGYVGNADQVGERTSCTWEEMNAISASIPEQTRLFSPRVRRVVLRELVVADMERFVDYDTQKVDFNNDAFRNILEFSKQNGMEMEELQRFYSSEMMMSLSFKMGTLAMTSTYIADGSSYATTTGQGEHVSFFGYPRPDEGGMAAVPEFTVSISKNTEYKNEAWDFIKSLLEDEAQADLPGDYASGIPINRAALNKRIEDEIKQEEFSRSLGANGESFFDQDSVPGYLALIESVKVGVRVDSGILDIICEEAEAYFAGQKGLDDVIKVIEKRVKQVVQERA